MQICFQCISVDVTYYFFSFLRGRDKGDKGIVYHGHYNPVDFTQDNGSFGLKFFARVLAYFEI
jgi:hypothetical protein